MNKAILTLLISFLAINQINAQAPKSLGTSDADAKKILDEVSAKFKAYKTVQAQFLLKIENGSGKSLGNKSGNVFMKGNKYRISASGQDIFSDGSNIWTYEKAANEVTINKIDPTANSITPQKLFTNFYDKDFLYKLNGIVKEGGKNLQEIELTPIDKTKPFFKVLLYVDKSTIYTTKVFEKTGNRYTYSINNMKTNGVITDDTFVFDAKKYPGVEVVDLR
ncbi:MAG: outer membrane lipoprotein carrier protein LolA [Bacteroidota bacterium]